MNIDTLIGISGILLTLFFGVIGMRVIKARATKKTQQQSVKDDSVAIQAGRDINIGKK